MKLILFLLLTSQAWGQSDSSKLSLPDTAAVYVIFQPFPGSAITAKDAYLIKGQLWYRSVAALNKGKWFPFRKGWRVIEIKHQP